MPVLTAAQIHKLNTDPISDAHILLVEIEEEHTGTVLRYARNNEDVVSNGETYEAATIEFSLPGYGEEIRPVSMTVSNVNRAPGRALVLSSERIMVRLMVIDYASPDTYLEDTQDLLAIVDADIDQQTVEARLISVIDWQSPVPFFKTTQGMFPGLFV